MENTDLLPQVHKQDERILAAMAHGAISDPYLWDHHPGYHLDHPKR